MQRVAKEEVSMKEGSVHAVIHREVMLSLWGVVIVVETAAAFECLTRHERFC